MSPVVPPLGQVGATPGDVVRTTVYVAAEERAVLERVWQLPGLS